MLTQDHVRHVLAITLQDADTAARWNNALQALAESTGRGVPVNTSTDPRNGAAEAAGAEFATQAADVSRWPEGLGMAALFDPERVREYAAIISREYRALGITTVLGPQIDISTEPRWMRLQDTWGPSSRLVSDYTRAYCDGMQTTLPAGEQPGDAFGVPAGVPSRTDEGWGSDSVATMVKHWPGGGSGEAGRDAHYGFGKFAVYPGHNEADHLRSFIDDAFQLDGPTGKASAVMPYYTISWSYETPDGQHTNGPEAADGTSPDGGSPRANSYNRTIVHDMLREKYGYDGVVCTDWGITADPDPEMGSFGQRCYGVEDLSVAERHALAIDNGVDQFGGNSEAAPVIEAYRIIAERDGEEAARARFEVSAARLLRTFFRAGLFENPYLDPEVSSAVVGSQSFQDAATAAQRDSLVLIKNGTDGAPASRSPTPSPASTSPPGTSTAGWASCASPSRRATSIPSRPARAPASAPPRRPRPTPPVSNPSPSATSARSTTRTAPSTARARRPSTSPTSTPSSLLARPWGTSPSSSSCACITPLSWLSSSPTPTRSSWTSASSRRPCGASSTASSSPRACCPSRCPGR